VQIKNNFESTWIEQLDTMVWILLEEDHYTMYIIKRRANGNLFRDEDADRNLLKYIGMNDTNNEEFGYREKRAIGNNFVKLQN
jgi:uncharacterized protein YllA (UPF0747 family)